MKLNWAIFENNILLGKVVSTLIVVLCLLLFRFLITRYIKKLEHYQATTRRRWIVSIHNTFLVLFLILLTVIWMEQLRTVTASLMLVAAAVVVATKEFILNVVGFFYRTGNKFISIGDRIEIASLRGDVVDQTFLGVTIIEIGSGVKTHQYTGLTVFIPNSMFLNSPVKNETRLLGDYVFHIINIPLKASANWRLAEKALMDAANSVCGPYLEEARHSMRQLAIEHSLDAPSAEPRISIQISEPERINLVLRIPIQARKRGRLEQEISKRYLMNLEAMEANEGIDDAKVHVDSLVQTNNKNEDL